MTKSSEAGSLRSHKFPAKMQKGALLRQAKATIAAPLRPLALSHTRGKLFSRNQLKDRVRPFFLGPPK